MRYEDAMPGETRIAEYAPEENRLRILDVNGDLVETWEVEPTADPLAEIVGRFGWMLNADAGEFIRPNRFRVDVVKVADLPMSVADWDAWQAGRS